MRMIKTLLALVSLVVLAVLVAKRYDYKKHIDKNRAESSAYPNSGMQKADLSNTETKILDSDPLKSSESTKELVSDNSPASSDVIPKLSSGEPNPTQEQRPKLALEAPLIENLRRDGFAEELGRCMLEISENNLKREHPLSFDGITDACAEKYGLVDDQKVKIRMIFRESIADSNLNIDLENWYKCASAKVLKSSLCLNEQFHLFVGEFYTENRGRSSIKSAEFQKDWGAKVKEGTKKILEVCSDLPPSLTEVYADECSR